MSSAIKGVRHRKSRRGTAAGKRAKSEPRQSGLRLELELPQGVQVEVDQKSGGALAVNGPQGTVRRALMSPLVRITKESNKLVMESSRATKREKKQLYTLAAHARNMFRGAVEGHIYELKICSVHFPMNVSVAGKEFIIKNFLGENAPRTLALPEGVIVKVEGDVVRVESSDKELAGRVASRIELLTRVTGRDRRVFQDGIFLTRKDGKPLL